MAPGRLALDEHGAALFRGAALAVLAALKTALAPIDRGNAGVRISQNADLAWLLSAAGVIGGLAAATLGSGCRPVRAIFFDKTADTNWALGWHQDRTIAVSERRKVPGFGPWTVKQGLLHVEPPFSVIEAMVTARVHLDAVPEDNAPLLIAPDTICWVGSPKPTWRLQSLVVGPLCVPRRVVTSGFTEPRSFMRRMLAAAWAGAGFCR